MKNINLKTCTIILLIILLSLISFLGIYQKELNKYVNILPQYKLGSEFTGVRTIRLDVSTETKTMYYDEEGNLVEDSNEAGEEGRTEEVAINNPEDLTKENYDLAKKIITERLKSLGANEYTIRQDDNGYFSVEIPEDDHTDHIVDLLSINGIFELKSDETGEILLDNQSIQQAKVLYGSTETGTRVYLSIQFKKDYHNKFKEISQEYIQTTDEEGNATTNSVTVSLDEETLINTYFGQTMSDGILQIPIGDVSTDGEVLSYYAEQAEHIASIINSGKMPIKYEVKYNNYIESSITKDYLELIVAFVIVFITTMIIYLIVEYKEKGILSGISFVGFIAILLIVVRFTDCIISIGGIVSLSIIIIFNYLFILSVLRKMKDEKISIEDYNNILKRYTIIGMPIYAMAIVFTFVSWLAISNFGIILFWGAVISLLYNISINRLLIVDNRRTR